MQPKPLGFTLLTNLEYDFLFNEGGDNLISFFATLRFHKNGIVFKRTGKQGTVAILKTATGLSRTSIEKYLSPLLSLDLVVVQSNGNIAVRSRKWTYKHLPKQKKLKLIPISIYGKFTDTKVSSRFIRIHSNIRSQLPQIEKRSERIKLLEELTSGSIKNLSDLKRAKRLEQDGLTVADLAESRLNSTLSNLGFDKILRPSENKNTKSAGKYHKHKMLNGNLIKQRRIIELKFPGVQDKRFARELSEDEDFKGGAFVTSKGIFIEKSPEISISSITPLSRCKKKAS
ncbi:MULTISPECIES: hypothetical protein [Flavobacteriaceae]|uniref:hypothetical protein n=1 Tax=Flavobacteriaceae TaxID=49546 RepID=UPI001490D426|nr:MULTISPECIES: hypothetical protein [Allomuricauda]MDC6366926.1 hypothetical protein [Muricauda sp. AC10]